MRGKDISDLPNAPKTHSSSIMAFIFLLSTGAIWLSELDDAYSPENFLLLISFISSSSSAFIYLRNRQGNRISFQALDNMRHFDILTGLADRHLFLKNLDERLHTSQYQNYPFMLLLIDIDRFKELDSILGLQNGDILLREFANRLKQFQPDEKYVARLSGNEFGIVIDDFEDFFSLKDCLAALHGSLKQPFSFNNRLIEVTVSGGYVVFPDHGYVVDSLMQQANLALLRAKQDGRDQICVFERRRDVRVHLDHELSQEMGKSIHKGEFRLHYQPQFDMKTGIQTGFEALLRWPHPTRGWISPGLFIDIAEHNGMILPLSEFALREACRTAAQWRQPLKVAVNLSPIQFKKTNLALMVERVLKETGLPAERLELEVTESLFIHSSQRTFNTLEQLRNMGISIALDDFGTGYSSLSYLSAFPIDKIKIDRSFVKDLSEDDSNMAIISAIVGIAKSLDMRITAEGIEDRNTLELLKVAGCHEVQGFLWGKPRDLEQEPGFEMTEPINKADRSQEDEFSSRGVPVVNCRRYI